MSDTPNTDAVQFEAYSGCGLREVVVPIAFAREQERRIAELEKERDAAYANGFAVGSGNEGEYQRRIAELESKLRGKTFVTPEPETTSDRAE